MSFIQPYALHQEAFNDIDEIRAYIAEDSPDAAPISHHARFGSSWCVNMRSFTRQKKSRYGLWLFSTHGEAPV